jgi:multidrug efflux pump subunit AcrA (membrane-fusion protein)
MRLADEPPAPWDASTVLVRFVVTAPPDTESQASARAPSAGDVGVVELSPVARDLLVFPESALLRSSEGPYVLVAGSDGKSLARRPVQIGRFLKGRVVVLSGLSENEQIVVGGAFFLDERRKREPAAGAVAEIVP